MSKMKMKKGLDQFEKDMFLESKMRDTVFITGLILGLMVLVFLVTMPLTFENICVFGFVVAVICFIQFAVALGEYISFASKVNKRTRETK